MSFWKRLFAKKVTIQFKDEDGNLTERKITEAQLQELEAAGAIRKTETIEVHVLDPKGNYTTTWEIGKDIPSDVAERATDPATGALYAVTMYEKGVAKTHVLAKQKWLSIKSQFDAIEQTASNVSGEIQK